MAQILVLADDFTGALDTGAQFSQGGHSVFVTAGDLSKCESADAVAIDMESRHLSPRQAYEKIYHQTEYAALRHIPFLYKKTDSTLRGNIGAELTAALLASGRKQLVFVPAFPRMGRTVEGGVFRVNGRLLAETSYARDPFQPIRLSRVADILRQQTALPVVEVGLPDRAPALTEKPSILICDAAEEQDMRRIAEVLRPVAEQVVLAGCAGFAGYAASYLKPAATKTAGPLTLPHMRHTILCGSINERTRRQVVYAIGRGLAHYHLQPGDYLGACVPEPTKEKIRQLQRSHNTVLLYTASAESDIAAAQAYAKQNGMDGGSRPLRIAEGLGRIASFCMGSDTDAAFSVTGGDTLFGVISAIGSPGLIPHGEILPGVILSQLALPGGGNRVFLSKAGSFGGESVLWDIANLFR